MSVVRKVRQDFQFSSGIVVPAGFKVGVATLAAQLDEVRWIFECAVEDQLTKS